MPNFSKYRLLLGALVIALLIGLPAILLATNKTTDNRSNAYAATTLAFSPSSSTSNPLKAVVGTPLPLDIIITPQTNIVSTVTLDISYDPIYFTADESSFVLDSTSKMGVQDGPIASPGKIKVTLGIGSDGANAIRSATKIGTLRLTPIAKTSKRAQTNVQFGAQTIILSINSTDGSQENVFQSGIPAIVVVSAPTQPKSHKPH